MIFSRDTIDKFDVMKFKATPFNLTFEMLIQGPSGMLRIIFGEKRVRLLSQERVTEALNSQYSLLRWADGETALARGKSIGYQHASQELRYRLKNIFENEKERLLIGIPPANFESIFNGKWNLPRIKIMFSTRVYLSSRVSAKSGSQYVSTFYWYEVYSELPDLLKQIKQDRPCLLVTGNLDFLKVCPANTEVIQTDREDAYENHEKVENEIDSWIENSLIDYPTLRPLILLACGPFSKVLVHEYANYAQMVDVGHGFNFYLAGKPKYAWE